MIGKQHELHKRRFGRNMGVGLVLGAMIAIIFGMTIVKVNRGDFAMKPAEVQQ